MAFLVGSILLTIALVRTRVVPVWVSVVFLLGIVVQLVGFTACSVTVITASAVICLVAMSILARQLWVVSPAEQAAAATRKRESQPFEVRHRGRLATRAERVGSRLAMPAPSWCRLPSGSSASVEGVAHASVCGMGGSAICLVLGLSCVASATMRAAMSRSLR